VDDFDRVIRKIPSDHPPGYQVFLYFWIHYIGDSEYLLRFPFAMTGIFSIFAMFLLGKKLFSHKEGIIAAALTAVLWTPLYYSQEARSNIMVLLFSVLSTYWLVDVYKSLRRGKKPPYTAVFGYILSAALLSYLHYFGLFFVLLQAAFMGLMFLFNLKAWFPVLMIYGSIMVLYIPWLERGTTALLTAGPGWLKPPNIENVFEYFQFLFNNSLWLTLIVFIFLLFLIAKGIVLVWRQPSRLKVLVFSADGLLFIWLFVPIGIVYLKSLFSTPAFTYRSLIILLPAAYLLLARSITLLPYERIARPLVTFLLICLFSYQLFWLEDYYNRPTKEQFREAVAFVNQNESEYPDAFTMSFTWDPIYLAKLRILN